MAGAPVAKTPHFALHRAALSSATDGRALFPVADAWLGVMLPKRWARRAVTRNTIRRQIYEVSRLAGSALPQAALVVNGQIYDYYVSARPADTVLEMVGAARGEWRYPLPRCLQMAAKGRVCVEPAP